SVAGVAAAIAGTRRKAAIAGLVAVIAGACVDTALPNGGGDAGDAGATPGDADAAQPDAGSGLVLLAPPRGSLAPLNRAAIVVAPPDGGRPAVLGVVDPGGMPFDATPRIPGADDPRCAGREEGSCAVLDLAEPLIVGERYRVLVDGLDSGVSVDAGDAW